MPVCGGLARLRTACARRRDPAGTPCRPMPRKYRLKRTHALGVASTFSAESIMCVELPAEKGRNVYLAVLLLTSIHPKSDDPAFRRVIRSIRRGSGNEEGICLRAVRIGIRSPCGRSA